jgi:hypothetical protein
MTNIHNKRIIETWKKKKKNSHWNKKDDKARIKKKKKPVQHMWAGPICKSSNWD